MTTENLLVEIGTEELPPKALRKLSTSFCRQPNCRIESIRVIFRIKVSTGMHHHAV